MLSPSTSTAQINLSFDVNRSNYIIPTSDDRYLFPLSFISTGFPDLAVSQQTQTSHHCDERNPLIKTWTLVSVWRDSLPKAGDNCKHTVKHHTVYKGLKSLFSVLKHPPNNHSPLKWTVPWIHMTCVSVWECVYLCVPLAIYIEPCGDRPGVLLNRLCIEAARLLAPFSLLLQWTEATGVQNGFRSLWTAHWWKLRNLK